MNSSLLNSNIRIAIHSLGVLFVLVLLFILSMLFKTIPITPYLIGGLMTGEILRIIFSTQKYLVSIDTDQMTVSIKYCNRMLLKKNTSIDRIDLDAVYIHETSWWLGRLDYINLSNAKQKFSFQLVDNKVKNTVVKTLDIE